MERSVVVKNEPHFADVRARFPDRAQCDRSCGVERIAVYTGRDRRERDGARAELVCYAL